MRPTLRPSARVRELPPVEVRFAARPNSPGRGISGAVIMGAGAGASPGVGAIDGRLALRTGSTLASVFSAGADGSSLETVGSGGRDSCTGGFGLVIDAALSLAG